MEHTTDGCMMQQKGRYPVWRKRLAEGVANGRIAIGDGNDGFDTHTCDETYVIVRLCARSACRTSGIRCYTYEIRTVLSSTRSWSCEISSEISCM